MKSIYLPLSISIAFLLFIPPYINADNITIMTMNSDMSTTPATTAPLDKAIVPVRIYGFLPILENARYNNDTLIIPSSQPVKLQLYGINFHELAKISFSPIPPTKNHSLTNAERCPNFLSVDFLIVKQSPGSFLSTINLRAKLKNEEAFYLCGLDLTGKRWYYQGDVGGLPLYSIPLENLLPVWLQIIFCLCLFIMSGMFSGLNLGLMSLNPTELNLVESSGSIKERLYAKRIIPVRRRGNFLLCTLLLGNVLVNSLLTVLMDDLTGSGAIAVVTSTLGITVFGEIIPQAVCSRYGLAVGASTIWITKTFMLLTSPLSFPISLVLDKVLGEEMGQEYSREKLRALIREQGITGNMVDDEVNIITGALSLTTKTVRDVMTPLHDAYMLSHDSLLDFDTLNEIVRNGFTRIPVYDQERSNIRAVLNVKDLAFIDPEAKTPVATVCKFYQRPILIVNETENLEKMLKVFRTGKTHMAFVENVVQDGEGDPYREMVGLVTLEDVIEEIIQAEIVDETDTVTDNVGRKRRQVCNQDFSVFRSRDQKSQVRLPPQLKIAALRHLSCDVDSFKEEYMDISVLSIVLNTDIVVQRKLKKNSADNQLYEADKLTSEAMLILQGYVTVEVTKEKLTFETGAFMFFGESMLQALNETLTSLPLEEWNNLKVKDLPKFRPDYTVRATSDLLYLSISARQYLFARRQSAMNRLARGIGRGQNGGSGDDGGSGGDTLTSFNNGNNDQSSLPSKMVDNDGLLKLAYNNESDKKNGTTNDQNMDEETFLLAWNKQTMMTESRSESEANLNRTSSLMRISKRSLGGKSPDRCSISSMADHETVVQPLLGKHDDDDDVKTAVA